MAQYLFTRGSILPGISVPVAGGGLPVLSDDWVDSITDIAEQEMGHLITVQNLLLSLNALPHVDRENFPTASPLFPFPFSLQPATLSTVAKYVGAEAPRVVQQADQADFDLARADANTVVGQVSRAGQIYERLFWLFQDSDAPQAPWAQLLNPFPDWPDWHIQSDKIGFNQDRQADPLEWRFGAGPDAPPDKAIYVVKIPDMDMARRAIYALALQGEGPVGDPGTTHFDKFLRIYRDMRAVGARLVEFTRVQAADPSTGVDRPATITDPAALIWARLADNRYQTLLMDIVLSLTIANTGTVSGTTAARVDFTTWAFKEMKAHINPLFAELCQLPLTQGATSGQPRAGMPFEVPKQDLPTEPTEQLSFLRARITESKQIRTTIINGFNPTTSQTLLLSRMDAVDQQMTQKLGV